MRHLTLSVFILIGCSGHTAPPPRRAPIDHSVQIAPPENDAPEPEPSPTAASVGEWLPVVPDRDEHIAFGAECLSLPTEPRHIVAGRLEVDGPGLALQVVGETQDISEVALPVRLALAPRRGAPVVRHCWGWRLTSCADQGVWLAVPSALKARALRAHRIWSASFDELRMKADELGQRPPDRATFDVPIAPGVWAGYPDTTTRLSFASGPSLDLHTFAPLFVQRGEALYAVHHAADELEIIHIEDRRQSQTTTLAFPQIRGE